MRALALLVALLSLTAASRAQALYRAVGDTGFGFGVGTTLNDNAADVAGSVIRTLAPSFDFAISVGRAELGRRTATTVGALGTVWVQRTTPTRAGLRAGVSYLESETRTGIASNVGAIVAGQVGLAPQTLLVPSLTADVIYVASDDFDPGFQTTISAGAALVQDVGGARVHVGPTVSLSSEGDRLGVGVGGGVLF